MAKISKTTVVEYKGEEYTLEGLVDIIRNVSKEELSKLIGNPKLTKLVAQYVKDYPECLKESGATAVTKK